MYRSTDLADTTGLTIKQLLLLLTKPKSIDKAYILIYHIINMASFEWDEDKNQENSEKPLSSFRATTRNL